MTTHCCAPAHSNCITATEAVSLRDMLNVLNVKVADGYGAEFRKQAGETRLERMGWALDRIADGAYLPAVDRAKETNALRKKLVAFWGFIEDWDGEAQEIARGIPVCDRNVTCEDCQAIGEVKHE